MEKGLKNEKINRWIHNATERQIIFFLVFLNILIKGAFLFIETTPSDVYFYTSTGKLLLNGIIPYKDFNPYSEAYDIAINVHHPNGPLNYIFYTAIILLFGTNVIAIKLPMFIAECLISIYLYKIGNILGGSAGKQKGLLISIIYSCLLPNYLPGILVGTDELITNAFAIIALYFFIRGNRTYSAIFLTLGISYKLFPVFYLPAFFLWDYNRKNLKEFFIYLIKIIIVYLIIAFPYLLLCPRDFINYNLLQANRFITISFGKLIEDSFLYTPLFNPFGSNFSITPHLLIEILIIGGYFLYDFHLMNKSGIYSEISLIKSISFYIIILPFISLSYNYRYFNWIIPLLLLIMEDNLMETNERYRKIKHKKRYTFSRKEQNSANSPIIKMKYSVIYAFLCESIILFVYIYQKANNSRDNMFMGIIYYNNYISTFFICYIGQLILFFILFPRNINFGLLNIFTFFNGIAGLSIYFFHEIYFPYNDKNLGILFLKITLIMMLLYLLIYFIIIRLNTKISKKKGEI